MTEYTDVPQVNSLYAEQQQIRSAIDYLSNGGMITTLMIVPPPLQPNTPPPSTSRLMVTINLPQPNPQGLVDQALAAFQTRDDEIIQQLTALGVTNPPSARRKS